ncbi:MAG: UvrD-helicase domain-containing protein [Actinomycetota bacterium]|nr:UvrD-helicase domain-containing protein [Actinomycetota bacterium]
MSAEPHDELAAEQQVIDRAYARIEAMRDQARLVADGILDQGAGGTHSARLERDVRIHVTERRLAELRIGDAPLCFGRTDHDDGERLYIGRMAVSDDSNDALVVDWRAPAAEPFYRATGRHPMGVTRRRHFALRGRRLVGIDDELLDTDHDDGGLVLVGEGALLATLERSRTGHMGDIVATIQAEQDEVIRAPLAGILVVEGGPGSGKTAVALHRAAYVLYTHRFPLERAGVLLVGPNRIFLRYIEDVLPSLGEHTVIFSTPSGLRPGTRVTGVDPPATARVKGDARMVEVVARAVSQRQQALGETVEIPYGRYRLTVSVTDSARLVSRARRRSTAHNERRVALERLLLRHLVDQLAGRGVPVSDEGRADMEEGLRAEPAFVAAANAIWPALTPEALLHRFLASPVLIERAGRGLLDAGECRALHRPACARTADVDWTDADVALLDEAAVVLGDRPLPRVRGNGADDDGRSYAIERALDDAGAFDPQMRADLRRRLEAEATDADLDVPDLATRTFGHVMVDEAQDLSPMQWRVIARRCPSGSMTIVGDLGQATGAAAPSTWGEIVAQLPRRRELRVASLTVNYRTPAEVMEVAARVLAEAAPDVVAPTAVRQSGVDPVFSRADPHDLAGASVRAALDEVDEVGQGKVAVVAPSGLLAELAGALGPDLARTGDDARVLDARVAVLAPEMAKGLEFDSVVVVEPARLVAESPQGLRALYVALTRTTRRLRVVHSEPLPAALVADVDPGQATPDTPEGVGGPLQGQLWPTGP